MSRRESRREKKRIAKQDPAWRERHSRRVWAFLLIIVFLVTAVLLEAYRCSHEFVVAEYELVTDKVTAPVTMVMISDLHESEFGKDNEELISAIRALSPDLILCAGDLITRTIGEDELHIGLDFIEAMAETAPCYMSLGNHEDIYIKWHGPALLGYLKERGVHVLECEYEDVTVRGQTVRIGGISDYCFRYSETQEQYESSKKYAFFHAFCDTEEYTVLLSHRPTAYRLNSELHRYEDWDLDLVLAGHTHGGLWQLPFIGCPYLPQQGFFPELDHGLKDMGNAQMIIGAGLGSEKGLFRLNDPCEVVLIRLVPEG